MPNSRLRSCLTSLVLLLLALACASCGREKKAVSPVRGKVFYQKKPAAGAIVFLHPVEKADPADSPDPFPRGVVGPDGSFEITTFAPGDGAPPGEYTATVVWKGPSRYGDSQDTNLLPMRYMSPRPRTCASRSEKDPTSWSRST